MSLEHGHWGTHLFVVVPDHILVVGVGVLRQEAVDEVLAFLVRELQHHVDAVNVPGHFGHVDCKLSLKKKANWGPSFSCHGQTA